MPYGVAQAGWVIIVLPFKFYYASINTLSGGCWYFLKLEYVMHIQGCTLIFILQEETIKF